MPVDLTKVNISLQQFQDISSGKYNAGEVKLASATRLGKMNHHVRQRFRNDEMISHQEVIAIKEALVRALSQHGVDPEEIGKVRRELGLSPDGAADRLLHARSIRPLSRQQIRQILDRNASTINSSRGPNGDLVHIATARPHVDPETEATRAEKRDAVNTRLAAPGRAVYSNRSITAFQAIVAGDVDYKDLEARQEIRRIARELLETALKPGDPPDGDAPATATFRLPSGQVVSAPTGMGRTAFARYLEDVLVRLDGAMSTKAEMDVRKHYEGLSPEERRAFLATLPDDPKGGFKARVVATMILHRRGFSDCETLSVPNGVSDANAIALAQYLADHPGLRGEALLRDGFFAQMKNARPPKPVPAFKQAYLPATTPLEFNKYLKLVLTGNLHKALPGHEALMADTKRIVRARLGETGLAEATPPGSVVLSGVLDDVIDPMTGNNTVRLTRATLREAYLQAALETAARRILLAAVEKEIAALHGGGVNASAVRNALVTRYPDYLRALVAAKSPAEVEQVNERFAGVVRDLVRTFRDARAAHDGVADRAHRGLADRLGISPEAVAAGRINLRQLEKNATELMNSILMGKAGFSSKTACETAFGDLADAFVAERVGRFAEVDALDDLPQATKDAIKTQLVSFDKVKGIDPGLLLDEARKIDTSRLETLLRDGAPADQVYAEMDAITLKIEKPIRARLALTQKEIGPDDVNPPRVIVTLMLAGLHPGLGGLVDGFFARPDVKNEILGEHYDRFMKSGSFNILSTDPGLHLDGDLALDTLRMQSFFIAPRNAPAGR